MFLGLIIFLFQTSTNVLITNHVPTTVKTQMAVLNVVVEAAMLWEGMAGLVMVGKTLNSLHGRTTTGLGRQF